MNGTEAQAEALARWGPTARAVVVRAPGKTNAYVVGVKGVGKKFVTLGSGSNWKAAFASAEELGNTPELVRSEMAKAQKAAKWKTVAAMAKATLKAALR